MSSDDASSSRDTCSSSSTDGMSDDSHSSLPTGGVVRRNAEPISPEPCDEVRFAYKDKFARNIIEIAARDTQLPYKIRAAKAMAAGVRGQMFSGHLAPTLPAQPLEGDRPRFLSTPGRVSNSRVRTCWPVTANNQVASARWRRGPAVVAFTAFALLQSCVAMLNVRT